MSLEIEHGRIPELGLGWCLANGALPVSHEGVPHLAFCGKADPVAAAWGSWRLDLPSPAANVLEDREEDLAHAMAVLRGQEAADNRGGLLGRLAEEDLAVAEGSTVDEIRRKSQSEPVVKLVDHVLDEALRQGATDIHLEPDEEGVSVRFRRDGMLRDFLVLPSWVQASLISRVKILAELDIAEKRLPQDGRIQREWKGESLDIRVSTLPTRMGEKVVLRLLRQTASVLDLTSVGMPDGIRTAFERLCDRPQGMVFVTGPTGSGKSSTLYAALQRLLPRAINITTIEDPIEYRLRGANQVQILEKAGLGFAEALRSILRQDPDVILVGEIRDSETAGIAVQAAQTGHLVFSTLHTNDAAGAITRLVDLGVPRFLVGSAVLGILAQRLVRRVCPHCAVRGTPSATEIELLAEWAPLPESVAIAVGCPECDGTGYNGRVGIFELLSMDDDLREAVTEGANDGEIRRRAGLRPLVVDGIAKVAEGLTTLEEVLRVGLR